MKELVRKVLLFVVVMLMVCPAACADVVINEANFPDYWFRSYVKSLIDKNNDGSLNSTEIASVTTIDVTMNNIASLKGVEHFTALITLSCRYNNLRELDVSKNVNLQTLNCEGNRLTTLDVSRNTSLQVLYCNWNSLETLDVSKNTALTSLICYSNRLTALDVSKNTALLRLNCSSNRLTTLDVSKNTALTLLVCGNGTIGFASGLSTLDVSKNVNLTYLDCSWNRLTTLDLSKNTKLTTLDCGGNGLSTLDISNNKLLESLACYRNKLQAVNVSQLPALKSLNVGGNPLTNFDFLNRTDLEDLRCYDLGLTTLDVSRFTALKVLNCAGNPLDTLDVSKNTVLEDLRCYGMNLSALDISRNTSIKYLDCEYNTITALDISRQKDLVTLMCGANPLGTLDVSNNTKLEYLYCSRNSLTTLDVRNHIDLRELYCNNNGLSTLDVSRNEYLENLDCSFNLLKTINFSSNGLYTLHCEGNQFITLDFNDEWLSELYCDFTIESKDNAFTFDLTSFMEAYHLDGYVDDSVLEAYTSITYPYEDEEDGSIYFDYVEEVYSYSLSELVTIDATTGNTIIRVPNPDGYSLSRIYFTYISNANDQAVEVNVFPYSGSAWYRAITITTEALADGTVGMSYGFQLQASGADSLTWNASGLPDGLDIDESGYISGTPTTAGTYTIAIQVTDFTRAAATTLTLTVLASGTKPAVTSTTLPIGAKDTPYSYQLTASGTNPMIWTLKGVLPAGLSMSTSGLISGTPTKKINKTFTVTASNDYGKGSKKLTLKVYELPTITTETLKAGIIGKKYAISLAKKGTAPFTWSITGKLPEGLSFDVKKGKFIGTPTATGTYTVHITLGNEVGSVSKDLTITVEAIAPVISPNKLNAGTWGKKYNVAIKTTKGTKPITLTLSGDLPEGLSFDSKTNKITGTPTETCTDRVITAIATNMWGKVEKEYKLTIKAIAPKITTTKLPNAKVNEPYSADLTATGTPTITWSAEGLPEGLTITTSGSISGTTEKSGTFTVKLSATNSLKTIKKSLKLNVLSAPSFDESGTLKDGVQGKSYSYILKATGTKTINYSIVGGTLPNGITLSKKGKFSGKPKVSGDFMFTVQAANAVGAVSMDFTLKIAEGVTKNKTSLTAPSVKVIEPEYIIVAELGTVSVDEAGMHEFGVTLGESVPTGAKLLWLARSDDPSDDDDIAEFYDSDGEEIEAVPEDRVIIVSAWLNPKRVYRPAIAITH